MSEVHKIAPDLVPLMVPVEDLHELPGNPRRGDVEAVSKSYSSLGQRKPIVYQTRRKKKTVIAGNHQLKAARSLGWTHIAAVNADDLTTKEAQAFAVADNRTSDLGEYDDQELLNLLSEIPAELFVATSYEEDDIEDLLKAVAEADAEMEAKDESDRVAHSLLDVSVDEPIRTARTGEVWELGPHVLHVCDLMVDYLKFIPDLTPGKRFTPYPSPYLPIFVEGDIQLVMVQPEEYLASHTLDKWASVHGEPVKR